jgi:hypothetical protein
LPASSVCLICLSCLPPLPCIPFPLPLLLLLPASHGQGRYSTRPLPALFKPPKLMPSVVVNLRTPALLMPGSVVVKAVAMHSRLILQ